MYSYAINTSLITVLTCSTHFCVSVYRDIRFDISHFTLGYVIHSILPPPLIDILVCHLD